MRDVTKDLWHNDDDIDTYDTLPNWLALFEAINNTGLSPDKVMREHNLFDTEYNKHITATDLAWRNFWEEKCCMYDKMQKRKTNIIAVREHLYKYQWLLKYIAQNNMKLYKNLMIKFEEMNENELVRPPKGRRRKDTTK